MLYTYSRLLTCLILRSKDWIRGISISSSPHVIGQSNVKIQSDSTLILMIIALLSNLMIKSCMTVNSGYWNYGVLYLSGLRSRWWINPGGKLFLCNWFESWEEETIASSFPIWGLHRFLPCIFKNFSHQILVRLLFVNSASSWRSWYICWCCE